MKLTQIGINKNKMCSKSLLCLKLPHVTGIWRNGEKLPPVCFRANQNSTLSGILSGVWILGCLLL